MIEILKTKKYLLLSLCLVTTNLLSQFSIEKITFNSANPFSLNDIISNLKNQDKQEVYGTLIIPDSTQKVLDCLRVPKNEFNLDCLLNVKYLKMDLGIKKPGILFKKIENLRNRKKHLEHQQQAVSYCRMMVCP